jgi:hypothetical protein
MQNNQRGGIASFIIVAIVLAGLFAGALYMSKQQGRQARDDTPAPQIAKTDDTTQDKTKEESTDTSGQTDAPKENGTVGTGENQQAGQTERSDVPNPTTNTASGTDRVASTGPSENLPATGPTETAATIAVVGILTFATYLAMSSRRALRSSALHK